MEKTEFTYIRFVSRLLYVLILIPFIPLFDKLTNILNSKFLNTLIVFLFYLICCRICDKITQKCELFVGKGAYWIEDGVVSIKKGKKVYNLKNIRALYGTRIRNTFYTKTGMLKIDYGKKTLTLVSNSTTHIENFAECELYPLFNTIIECNPELEKDDTLDYLYEIKRGK
ncbi:MAG: hypothetical protein E7593_01770 [Ruminococcaceae bacterium]|nr:hypothetical protein [Oscillospiraceae bacterium]